MYIRYTKIRMIAAILIIAFLLFQCISCGSAFSTSSSAPAGSPAPQYEPPKQPTAIIPGLLDIELPTEGYSTGTGGLANCNHIILATDRLTYNSVEMQQIQKYFNNRFTSSLPSTLTTAQVILPMAVPNWDIYPFPASFCTTEMDITNIGQEPIQITQIGMKLTSDPQPDNRQYRLINRCSFILDNQQLCPGEGNGRMPQQYGFYFGGPAHSNTVFQGQTDGGQPILQPKDTLVVLLNFLPMDQSGYYLKYSFIPEITISTTSTQKQVFDLPQLAGTNTFSTLDHFSCYQPVSNRFVPVTSPDPSSSESILASHTIDCSL